MSTKQKTSHIVYERDRSLNREAFLILVKLGLARRAKPGLFSIVSFLF